MEEAQIRDIALEALQHIAPEVDVKTLRPDRLLRDEVDLDSMDWLRYISALHQRLGVNIPEADYQLLISIDAVVSYLQKRLEEGARN
jgi:polyketide biosynthesis acyl carrier protein